MISLEHGLVFALFTLIRIENISIIAVWDDLVSTTSPC